MKKPHLLGVACLCFFFSLPAYSADKYWVCDDDAWDATCWSGTFGGPPGIGQPVVGDDVYLLQSDSLNRTITYQNASNPTDQLNSLTVDATGSGLMNFSQSQDTINIDQTIIGDYGQGSFNLTGGTHNAYSLILGNQVGSFGEYSIGGSATFGAGQLLIGNYGQGVFNVSNGATFMPNGFWANVGVETGASGTVTVSGASALWEPTNLTVGNKGNGDVSVINGGTLHTLSGDLTKIGYQAGSTGVLTVSGTNSNWYHGDDNLDVGYLGDGTVNVLAGGELRSGQLTIGAFAGSNGEVTVSGPGSSIYANQISIGVSGSGILNVTNGANLLNSGGTGTGGFIIAQNAGTTGVVNIDNTNIDITALSIGYSGNGELHVSGGGTLDVLSSSLISHIGQNAGSNGLLTLTGSGTQLDHANSLLVGTNGSGTINISNGAKLFVQNELPIAVGNSGVGTVTMTGGSHLEALYLDVGVRGTGSLSIASGSTAVVNGVWNTIAGYYSDTYGTTTVDGVGSNLTFAGFLGVGGGDIPNGEQAGGTGILNVQNGGSVNVNGDMSVWDTSTVNLNGGDLTVMGIYTTSGNTVVNGNLSANAVEVLDGKVTGNGTIIADLMNKGGKVNPGNSPGTLTIDGNYTQEAGGTLVIEIAGLGSFDILEVLGTADFQTGSSIDLHFINGFAPSTSDVFEFLVADSFTNDLSGVSFNVLGLEDGFDFNVGFTLSGDFSMTALNDGVSAVPVPAAIWLFGSGLVGLTGLGRRRKAA